jgi:hypothetical protein
MITSTDLERKCRLPEVFRFDSRWLTGSPRIGIDSLMRQSQHHDETKG